MAEQVRELMMSVAADHAWLPETIAVKPLNSGGANYTTTLYSASASAADRDDKLFAKFANISEKIRGKVNRSLFDIEKYIYTELAQVYKSIEDEHEVPSEHRLRFPKFYAADTEPMKETLILEDLTASEFGCYDRLKVVTWEYASKAITELAKWHALSMAYEVRDPEGFAKAKEFLVFCPPAQSEDSEEGFRKILAGVMAAVRPENVAPLQRYLPQVLTAYTTFNSPNTRPVFAHGDFRVSNLMHKRKGGELQIIPVDYQTVHTGCPASDIAYFIFTATDREFRKLHYTNLIEHYYKQLGKSLERLGLDVDNVYSRKDFDEDLKQVLPHVMVIAIIVLPFVLVEEEAAPDLSSGDMEQLAIKPNALYCQRLNEIIDDLVEWGVL